MKTNTPRKRLSRGQCGALAALPTVVLLAALLFLCDESTTPQVFYARKCIGLGCFAIAAGLFKMLPEFIRAIEEALNEPSKKQES